jgi:hypothetical protein
MWSLDRPADGRSSAELGAKVILGNCPVAITFFLPRDLIYRAAAGTIKWHKYVSEHWMEF